jgi:hypothetical protein
MIAAAVLSYLADQEPAPQLSATARQAEVAAELEAAFWLFETNEAWLDSADWADSAAHRPCEQPVDSE